MTKRFLQVDAFSPVPLFGNPAAVVLDADDLSTETMQKIAQEKNLSESVFICKPTTEKADYRARIFTPIHELPFAGHPTLAACYTVMPMLTSSVDPLRKTIYQECGAGIISVNSLDAATVKSLWTQDELPVDFSKPVLIMTQLTPKYEQLPITRQELAEAFGTSLESTVADTPVAIVNTGVNWAVAEIASIEAIANLTPDYTLIAKLSNKYNISGFCVFADRKRADPSFSGTVQIRVRTFAPAVGINEDPVCGSGNGSVCGFISKYKNQNAESGNYVGEQGVEIGRHGYVFARWDYDDQKQVRIHIGGQASTAASGELYV